MDPNQQASLQKLADELGNDVPLIKTMVAHFKAGGIKNLTQDLPAVVDEARKDYAAVSDALPVVKAGYRTTEFWLVVAVLFGNAGYFAFTQKTLPFDLNATLASLVGVYTVVRALMKKTPAPAAAPVAPAAAPGGSAQAP